MTTSPQNRSKALPAGHLMVLKDALANVLSDQEQAEDLLDRTTTAVADALAKLAYGTLLYRLGQTRRERDELTKRAADLVAVPSEWDCAHGTAEDKPFCQELDDEHPTCPTIRVHRDDADRFTAMVDMIHELRTRLGQVESEKNRATRAFEALAEKHDKAKTERDELRKQIDEQPTDMCTAEYGGPGYTHCELTAGHGGRHESALGNMQRATWGAVR